MRLTRRLVRAFVIFFAALCLISPSDAEARRVLVTLKADRQQIEGNLIGQSDDQVTLLIAGIKRIIPRAHIAEMKLIQTVAEEFAERRAKLDNTDLHGRYQLSRWLYEKKSYSLAKDELKHLANQFPNDDRVVTLARIVSEAIKKAALSSGPTAPVSGLDAGIEPEEPDLDDRGLPQKRLSIEQVNLIKIFEIDLDAKKTNRPTIIVPRKTVETILDKYADDDLRGARNRQRFKNAKGYNIFEKMVELSRDFPAVRSLYDQLIVRGDPKAMRIFRTKIHKNYVLNYCATASCHGGPDAGKLFLFRSRPTNKETAYTNFYILDAYQPAGRWDMIDRFDPERSLLIQYGLPREDTNAPHSKVRGWRPRLRATGRRPMLSTITNWISQLQEDRPNYMINYKIPILPKKKNTGSGKPTGAAEPKTNEANPIESIVD